MLFRSAHEEAFAAVLRSPLRYFGLWLPQRLESTILTCLEDVTPAGKILNVFISDMTNSELTLPLTLQEALQDFTGVTGNSHLILAVCV